MPMIRASYVVVLAACGFSGFSCGGAAPEPMAPPPAAPPDAPPAPAPSAAAPLKTAPAPAAPTEPKPTPEQTKTVDAFAGDWTFDATVTPPGGKPIKTPIAMSCKRIAYGKGASCMNSDVIPGMGLTEGSFLIGFDPLDKTMHFMAVTSDDEIHDHHCKWQDDTNLVCEPLKGAMGGQPITEDLSFGFQKDAASFKSVVTMKNGKFVFEATNGKRGSLPPKKAAGKANTKPSADQKKLVDAFAGEWKVDGTMTTPDNKTDKAVISISATKTALGKGVSALMRGTSSMGPFESGFLIGFDPFDKTVHFMAVTSDDELHDHRCHWKDTRNLVCESLQGGMGGQPITEDLSFTFDTGSMSFKSIVTMKDGSKVVFDAKGSR